MRASNHSGQCTCRWAVRACAIVFSWVSRARMASLKGRSHEKYTVSIPANNGVMCLLSAVIGLSPRKVCYQLLSALRAVRPSRPFGQLAQDTPLLT